MFAFFGTWQPYVFMSIICAVIFNQSYKKAVVGSKHDGAATIVAQLIASVTGLILIPFFSWKISANPTTYLLLLAACVFYAVNDRFQTTARRMLPVSTFVILNQLSTVFVIIFGFVFFKNAPTVYKILGAAIILLTNTLLLYKKSGKFQWDKSVVASFIARLSFALALSIDIGISKQFNLPFYIMLTLFIPALFIAASEKISIKALWREFIPAKRKAYVLTGVVWTLWIFVVLRSFQLGEVVVVAPLQSLSILANVLVAYFFFGEKDHGLKKIFLACLMIAGVWFTTR